MLITIYATVFDSSGRFEDGSVDDRHSSLN